MQKRDLSSIFPVILCSFQWKLKHWCLFPKYFWGGKRKKKKALKKGNQPVLSQRGLFMPHACIFLWTAFCSLFRWKGADLTPWYKCGGFEEKEEIEKAICGSFIACFFFSCNLLFGLLRENSGYKADFFFGRFEELFWRRKVLSQAWLNL